MLRIKTLRLVPFALVIFAVMCGTALADFSECFHKGGYQKLPIYPCYGYHETVWRTWPPECSTQRGEVAPPSAPLMPPAERTLSRKLPKPPKEGAQPQAAPTSDGHIIQLQHMPREFQHVIEGQVIQLQQAPRELPKD